MSAPPSQWSWDPHRQGWFQLVNGLYRYQDGTVVDRNGAVISSPTGSSNTAVQQTSHLGNRGTSTGQDESDLVSSLSQFTIANTTTNAATYGSQSQESSSTQVADSYATNPAQATSAPVLIKGTPGKVETLHPGYKFHPKTFKVGRVFKVLWPEPMGATTSRFNVAPSNISQVTYGEKAHAKIAWFVVVTQQDTWSLCLRIQTYSGQACLKPGIRRGEHAIIHTSSKPPDHLSGETGMLPPIRVSARSPSDKLDPKSRINLAKLYTVEHNVKVFEFGRVHHDSEQLLLDSWNAVFRQMQQGTNVSATLSEEPVLSTTQPVMTQQPSGQAMHNKLVLQYAAYLRDEEENDEAALALVGGIYQDQIAIYTNLMMKGITPEATQHKLLVSHYIRTCRNVGQQLKPHRVCLERGSVEEQAEVYAGLILANYPLPTLAASPG